MLRNILYENNENVLCCMKDTANKNSSARKTQQNRSMLASNCAVCGKKKSIKKLVDY